tara:strand:+ start:213 stop:563 length:351 start_codon:yes stop_codon:yes gene_type:complete
MAEMMLQVPKPPSSGALRLARSARVREREREGALLGIHWQTSADGGATNGAAGIRKLEIYQIMASDANCYGSSLFISYNAATAAAVLAVQGALASSSRQAPLHHTCLRLMLPKQPA